MEENNLKRLGDDTRFIAPIKIDKNKWVTAIIKDRIDDEFISVQLGIATIENDRAIIEYIEREQLVEIYRSAKTKKMRKLLWDLMEATSYGTVEEDEEA